MSIKYVRTRKQKEAFFEMEFENKLTLTVYALIVELSSCFGMIMVLIVPSDLVGYIFPYRAKMPEFIPIDVQKVYVPLAIIVIGFQNVAMDFLNVAFMNLTRCQLQMLNMSFDELNERKVGRVNVDPVKHLNSIIEHHTLILNIRDQIESIFKYPMLVQFMFSLLIFALTGFQAFFQSNTSGLIMVYLYVGCILAELFVYCWFGTEVSEQNKTLAIRAYDSSWYNFDVKYRKSLVIFLMNAQRPFYFTAGGYLKLSLSMFGQILSKSYSFVALLRQQYSD
ncbi:odorant receptor 85c-like [Episyrphus balteatus]|uniref:odorant receptor 85c-like n=1 Tax=Episyrphus balteatus TaxID=286459 RepID=UPI002484EE24|nr:odorant receptor 85c-like [Episyrphus balteatus]